MQFMSIRFLMILIPLRIAAALGGPLWSFNWARIIIRTYAFLFGIALKRPRPVTIRLEFLSHPFEVTLQSSVELALIREIFLDHEYAHPHAENAKAIFDVGANIGMASIYLTCLYPRATVYAFESDPAVYERLAAQVRGFERIKPFHMALAGTDGTRTFYIHPKSILSGSLVERVPDQKKVTVQARRVSSMLDELGLDAVDVVKFDIEGGEEELFLSPEDRARIGRVIGEVHLDILSMTKEKFESLFPEFDTEYTRRINEHRYLFFARKR